MVRKYHIGTCLRILVSVFLILFLSGCSGGSSGTSQDDIPDDNPVGQAPNLCENGVQDAGETGVDCGGSCGTCPPACDDGILNQDEVDIDCGGSCETCLTGRIFYIANDGDDDENSGESPDTPWKTIGHVNEQAFIPGDAILFKRGDTWRERLIITWSGTPGNYITFGAYGTGDKPEILGSESAVDWAVVDGYPDVWRSGTSLDAPYAQHPASIFFGEPDSSTTWGRAQTDPEDAPRVNTCGENFSSLQQEYDWCYDDAIYVYSVGVNPGEAYDFVEVPQRRGSITMESHNPEEYIVIDGLSMMYGTMYGYNDGWPMNYEAKGLTIRNCHISHIGLRGGRSAMGLVIWHSDMLVKDNDIHDCGRRSISYNVYTDNNSQPDNLVFENVVFENNTLHNGYHTTGFDISHGNKRASTFRNFTFRNNFIYDDTSDDPTDGPNDFTSMSLYLAPGSALFTDIKIHNNVIKNPKQKGLAIGGVRNLEIYNNVIYGMNPNIGSSRPMVSISGEYQNVQFNNNIIYGTVDRDAFDSRCVYLGGSEAGITSMDHNIYFQEDDGQYIMYTQGNGGYHMSDWSDYRSDTNWDLSSPVPQDPMFVDPENNNFHLKPGSPAIDAGEDVGLDFEGNAPDIGAFESSYSAE